MMIKKILNIIVVSIVAVSLVGCDDNQDKTQITLEERLVDSFALADETVRARVEVIVEASKERNYELAMNELSMLSASQIHNQARAQAIKLLMTRLRYNMEEDEFAASAETSDN